MIFIFISGLSSKVKIKVKNDVNPQCLQLRREREKDNEKGWERPEVESAELLWFPLPQVSTRNRKQHN